MPIRQTEIDQLCVAVDGLLLDNGGIWIFTALLAKNLQVGNLLVSIRLLLNFDFDSEDDLFLLSIEEDLLHRVHPQFNHEAGPQSARPMLSLQWVHLFISLQIFRDLRVLRHNP